MRYFTAVADRGSFTGAARELHVAQQAVSQQVRALEQLLGVTLLERHRPDPERKRPILILDLENDLADPSNHHAQLLRARSLVRLGPVGRRPEDTGLGGFSRSPTLGMAGRRSESWV